MLAADVVGFCWRTNKTLAVWFREMMLVADVVGFCLHQNKILAVAAVERMRNVGCSTWEKEKHLHCQKSDYSLLSIMFVLLSHHNLSSVFEIFLSWGNMGLHITDMVGVRAWSVGNLRQFQPIQHISDIQLLLTLLRLAQSEGNWHRLIQFTKSASAEVLKTTQLLVSSNSRNADRFVQSDAQEIEIFNIHSSKIF